MPSDRSGAAILDLLERHAAIQREGCRLLERLVERRTVPGETAITEEEIGAWERAGRKTARELRNRIYATSVTPIDAEDLRALMERLEELGRGIQATARGLTTCGITLPSSGAVGLVRLLARGSQELAEGVALLRDLGNRERILDRCDRIDRMAEDAKRLVDDSLAALFESPRRSVADVIGLKDVYEHIAASARCCRDAADVVRRILARNAWGRAAPFRP